MRSIIFKVVGTGLALTLLGGCLGTENPDFNQQAVDALRFINDLEDLPVTAADDLPSGTVAYSGLASFNYDAPRTADGVDLLADMTLTADFDTNRVEGTIDRFNSPSGNVSGSVDVTDGAIVLNALQANGEGTIVEGDTSTELTFELLGQFRDTDGSVATGEIEGTYSSDDGSEGALFGNFGVEQN